MPEVTWIVAQMRAELSQELRERVRERLLRQPVEWLVEQLLDLTLPGAGEDPLEPANDSTGSHRTTTRTGSPTDPAARPRAEAAHATAHDSTAAAEQTARLRRLQNLGVEESRLPGFVARYRALGRETLEAERHLLDPPHRGGPVIGRRHRTTHAEHLLQEAKDLLYGLVHGGEDEGVRLLRVERETLTFTMPRAKTGPLAFLMPPTTRAGSAHTDRGTVRETAETTTTGLAAGDDRPADLTLRIEYGEVAGEHVGAAVAAALRLINDLEINEPVVPGGVACAETPPDTPDLLETHLPILPGLLADHLL